MISLQEFKEMEKGTLFYVCNGGNANNMVTERFLSVRYVGEGENRRPCIFTFGGATDFDTFMKGGECCYLKEEDAIKHMDNRSRHNYHLKGESLKRQAIAAQERVEEHYAEVVLAPYTVLDHSDLEEPDMGWYDKYDLEE